MTTSLYNLDNKSLDELKGQYVMIFNELGGTKNNQKKQHDLVAKLNAIKHSINNKAVFMSIVRI